jgi:hypothetical protein
MDGLSGWKEDKETGQLIVTGKPDQEVIERTESFYYERPKKSVK